MSIFPGSSPALAAVLGLAVGLQAGTGETLDKTAIPALVKALSGPDAGAEWRVGRALVSSGDAAVPALQELAAAQGPLPPRLVAVELLGEIGTRMARESLLHLLATEKRVLAVRGQVCMQLGTLRERGAVPLIADWMKSIGPRSIHDVRGPKEVQPSTTYIRHMEALTMIGDESGIAILEEFRKKIPQNVGWHGFLTNFVTGAVDTSLQDLKEVDAFWKTVRQRKGLDEAVAPLLAHLRDDAVARLRFHESEVIRGTERGRGVLRRLAEHKDPAVAKAARELLRLPGAGSGP